MKKIIILLLVIAVSSFSPINQGEIKLELTVNEVNQILKALNNEPYKEVAPLIQKVISQAGPQADSLNKKK